VSDQNEGAALGQPDFIQTLETIRFGSLAVDLTTQLEALVEAVKDTGRPGSLTLKLSVKPFKGDASAVTVVDEVKLTRPSAQKGETVFFATQANRLQRNDPRQPQLAGLRTPALAPAREATRA
jgi:hypothetical protein